MSPPLRRSAKGNSGQARESELSNPDWRRAPQAELSGSPPAQSQKKRRESPFFPKKKPPRRSAPTVPRTPHAAAFCCILLHTAPTSLHTAAHRSTPPCPAKSLRRAPAEAGKMRKETGGGEKKRKKRKRKKTAPNETPGRPPNPASLLRNQISRNAASAYSAGKIKNVWLIRTKKL